MDATGNFEPGDLVYLKSGSAKLTVTHYDPITDVVAVAWMYYETQELRTATLPAKAVKAPESEFITRTYARRDEVVF